jgi:alkylation response protein AidB-like acyl-CoA dehydrogenase
VLNSVLSEFLAGSNLAFWMYAGLTQGAIADLQHHGTEEQKRTYLPKMISGEWTGTMNLTEPQAGTDLGIVRTKAARSPDGSFAITGTKIFISAGEHDLAENIVHLVLARLEGAPAGIRGITLFIVPKVLLNADGSLGTRNAVSCGSIEEKMGIHGNATCVINYDGATGFLIGEENRGLPAMFTMMNHARLEVGVHGIAISEAAYQNAASTPASAKGARSPARNCPTSPPTPRRAPDVRRMLMTIRAITEAHARWRSGRRSRATSRSRCDPKARGREDHMALTPVISVSTDMGSPTPCWPSRSGAVMATSPRTAWSSRPRRAHQPDLRGRNGVQAMDLVESSG